VRFFDPLAHLRCDDQIYAWDTRQLLHTIPDAHGDAARSVLLERDRLLTAGYDGLIKARMDCIDAPHAEREHGHSRNGALRRGSARGPCRRTLGV
jgi:hypothetical protein